ncbi:helix-turn-helix transcriptional regulator [Collimonas sp.]|jgi:transcriptional regulator with XRE-family HTH domain|uniref:helix-turn-helix domain-containing protein n=1 Tax=Collimonas sp. TaxID=1963772 RepID=UPI002CDC1612|nr:helix-turn-helix transcriptional regulator [Collimonas sp.]HWW05900.1 helix-turn-helix transcriptional regulator [Collimonas sp.]
MTPVGQFVVAKRNALGITQDQLAQKLGVNGSYVNRIEKGGKSPGNLRFLENLAVCLELSPDETATLFTAARLSQRVIRMPANLSPRGYVVIANLVSGVSELNDAQLGLLETMINAVRCGAMKPSPTSLDV